MTELTPHFEDVRSHYDLSDDFYRQFLDPTQSLQLHYARTLETWAQSLDTQRDEAMAVQSEEVYQRYMKYLTGCADMFRRGYIDVNQFTLRK